MRLTTNWLTTGLIVTGFAITLYLMTWVGNPAIVTLPAFMLTGGLVMYLVMGGVLKKDNTASQKEFSNTLFYAGFAFAVMMMVGSIIPYVFRPPLAVTLSQTDGFLYGQLYAISEEVFFRGAITSFLLLPMKNLLSGHNTINLLFIQVSFAELATSLVGGVVFGIYHLARYGIGEAFMYVTFAGAALTFVTLISFKKRGELRLGSAILAHMANNGWDFLMTLFGGLI